MYYVPRRDLHYLSCEKIMCTRSCGFNVQPKYTARLKNNKLGRIWILKTCHNVCDEVIG